MIGVRSALLVVAFGCSGPIERLEATNLDQLTQGFEPTRRGEVAVGSFTLHVEASWHQAIVRTTRPANDDRARRNHAVWLLDASGAVVDHVVLAAGCETFCGERDPELEATCKWRWLTLPDRDRVVEVVVTEEPGEAWFVIPTGPIVARMPLARIQSS